MIGIKSMSLFSSKISKLSNVLIAAVLTFLNPITHSVNAMLIRHIQSYSVY